MKAVARTCGVALGFAVVMALAPPAQATTDTTGPQLTVAATPSFVIGQSFGDTENEFGIGFGGALEYRWTASDPSGICRYSVDELYIEGWTEGTVEPTHATSGHFGFSEDAYVSSSDLFTIRINAWDCAGNHTSVERQTGVPQIFVDYGASAPSGWTSTSCTCAINDSTLRTSTKNASLSTAVYPQGQARRVALVMAKGPGRGQAAIYWDGRLVKTVDTYAAADSNRVVMWDHEVSGTARHTIRLVNLATAGRPRIDVDAYLTMRLGSS